jgi:hypothetical protein
MKSYNLQEFVALKAEIEACKRLCGYYIIKLVDITDMRDASTGQEEIADEAFRYFDDQPWPPIRQRPDDETWAAYVVERDVAAEHAIEALVGGSSVGHLRDTIPWQEAIRFFERFEALFDEPKNYYIGMGFGDRRHVFLQGVAIISRSRAGVLWVVESAYYYCVKWRERAYNEV